MLSVDIVAEKHCFYNGVVVLGKLEIYDKLKILGKLEIFPTCPIISNLHILQGPVVNNRRLVSRTVRKLYFVILT